MNAASTLLAQPSIQTLGWTLLHFVWQGALIAAVFALVRFILRGRSANSRYLAGCVTLLALLAAPVVTFSVLNPGPAAPHTAIAHAEPPPTSLAANPPAPTASPDTSTAASAPATFEPPPSAKTVSPLPVRIEPWLPWLVAAWFLGVFVLSVRLLLGWIHVRRLRTRGNERLSETWQRRFEQLCRRMAVSRPVRLLRSSLVEVPAVIGCLRPIVLVPGSALTGLTSAQLESVLAHELAHVRRHDYLVNLLQNVIETLLFYHPAVWWVSRRVREERENCCDDLAVAVSNEPVVYAEALASLEELRRFTPQLALGAGGSDLLSRVRRILGLPDGTRGFRPPLAGFIALLGVTVVLTSIALYTALQREPVYYGKPVSTWIGMLGTSYHQAAHDVLTTAGDEVLPYLEKAIVARESWFSQKYRSTHEVLPGLLAGIVPEPRSRNFFQVRAATAELIPEVTSDPDLALPILMRPLDEADTASREAVRALGEFRSSAAPAVPKLISLLNDPDHRMRSSVAATLHRIGPAARDAGPVLAALMEDEERRVRIFSAQTLGAIGAHPDVAIPALLEAAQSDDSELRFQAIQSLGRYGANAEPAVPEIAEALADPDPSVRRSVLGALAGIGSFPGDLESTIQELATHAESPSERGWATLLLWRTTPDDPELTDELVTYLRWSDPPTVGSGMLYRLSLMDPVPRHLAPILREIVDEGDYFPSRRFAAQILVNLDPEYGSLAHYLEPTIAPARSGELDPARQRIIEIFARNHFDSERIVPELLNLLDDKALAAEAVHGLIETEPMNRPGTHLLSLLSDRRPHVQVAALDVLSTTGYIPRAGLAVLPDLLLHPEDSIRVPAARHTITYVGSYPSDIPPTLRPALEAAASDPNEEFRTLAARALDRLEAE